MQPPVEREAEEEERRGGSKIYGVTNYWQQLVLSRLPTTWMSLLSLVSTKFHLLPCGIWIRTCNCRFMVPSAVLIWGRKGLENYEVGAIDKLSPIFGKCPPVTSQRGLTAFKGCCASIVDLTLFHHHETLCSEF